MAGLRQGGTVAVMGWHSKRYLEVYLAMPMICPGLMVVNVCLALEQIAHTPGSWCCTPWRQRPCWPAHRARGGCIEAMSTSPITPMFHVHAWGVPYVATLLGIKQVYPGRYLPGNLLALIAREKVSFSHCVPTIWTGCSTTLTPRRRTCAAGR